MAGTRPVPSKSALLTAHPAERLRPSHRLGEAGEADSPQLLLLVAGGVAAGGLHVQGCCLGPVAPLLAQALPRRPRPCPSRLRPRDWLRFPTAHATRAQPPWPGRVQLLQTSLGGPGQLNSGGLKWSSLVAPPALILGGEEVGLAIFPRREFLELGAHVTSHFPRLHRHVRDSFADSQSPRTSPWPAP